MEYSDAYLREVLPERNPPGEYVPQAVNSEIARWLETDDLSDPELIARSTRWTYALFSELRQNQFEVDWRGLPPWEFYPSFLTGVLPDAIKSKLTVGLFDPQSERSGFGLIIYIPQQRSRGTRPRTEAYFRFPRLNLRVPMLTRQYSIEDHAPDHVTISTSASWAQCQQSGLWGVLTAGHTFQGLPLGSNVPMSSGNLGVLHRSIFPALDVAFVNTQKPTSYSPLPIRRFAAMGQPVVVESKNGPQHRTVLDPGSQLQVVNTISFAVVLLLDQPLVLGDSGALVRSRCGEAMGIYLGDLKTPVAPQGLGGRALNFEQSVLPLNLTPYL